MTLIGVRFLYPVILTSVSHCFMIDFRKIFFHSLKDDAGSFALCLSNGIEEDKKRMRVFPSHKYSTYSTYI